LTNVKAVILWKVKQQVYVEVFSASNECWLGDWMGIMYMKRKMQITKS